jgi:hypothetical protein
MLALIEYGECRIVPEHDKDSDLLVQRIHINPKPTPELSVAVGDFLFAVRSALDHLACQLVIANGSAPDTKTMFPITSSPELFTGALVKRKRLRGASTASCALIERLQPYHAGNKVLERLDALHNADKHRTLNLTTVVADNTSLRYYRAGHLILDMFLGDEELCDGAVFGGIGVPMSNPEIIRMFPSLAQTLSEVEVKGEASLFVAFDQVGVEFLEDFKVGQTLKEILGFVKKTVIPRFKPLFE